jgi:hypothetical protein
MNTPITPTPAVGEWYRRPNGSLFEVVAVDTDDDTIEVQHFDGTLEEIDFDSWRDQPLEEADAPEDWTGSVDVEPEDVEDISDASAQSPMQTDPLDYLDRAEASGFSEWPTPSDERFD